MQNECILNGKDKTLEHDEAHLTLTSPALLFHIRRILESEKGHDATLGGQKMPDELSSSVHTQTLLNQLVRLFWSTARQLILS